MEEGDQEAARKARALRALGTLTAAQALGLSGAPLVVMVAGIVGAELAPAESLASLPLATMVVGTALGSAPAALGMRRLGRRWGFASGAMVGAAGAVLGSWAMVRGDFVSLTLATIAIGASLAFVMQYRFAAAESVGAGRRERAVGVVMSGGVAAGLLGPELGKLGRHLLATPWAGSFLILAGVYATLAALVLVGLEDDRATPGPADLDRAVDPTRAVDPSRAAAGPSDFAVAVAAGVTAYAVMTLLMTSTPLAMRVAGFGADETALVIQAHVVAMYAPSVFSGTLVARFGPRRLMSGGLVCMAGCVALGLSGDGLGAWVLGLIFLGLGWNALFLGATVSLAESASGEARYRAQALNEALVFGAQALASLAAGSLVAFGGWPLVNAFALGPLTLMALFLTAASGLRTRSALGRR